MNYLQVLETEKKNREKYYEETVKMKEIVKAISDYYSVYDGDFLQELDKFMNNYKKSKEN